MRGVEIPLSVGDPAKLRDRTGWMPQIRARPLPARRIRMPRATNSRRCRDPSVACFKNRGLLLSLPAGVLAAFGKPSAAGIAAGLPLAVAGEAIRCWAVGYSGATTRNDTVTAPALVTGGPYAHVRNPLYIGNFLTAAGFAIAFTGENAARATARARRGSLAAMAAVYATIVPHEERFCARSSA